MVNWQKRGLPLHHSWLKSNKWTRGNRLDFLSHTAVLCLGPREQPFIDCEVKTNSNRAWVMISSLLGPRRWPSHGHASHEPRRNTVFMPPPEPQRTKTPCNWFWRFPWLPSTSLLARHTIFQGTLTYLKVLFSFLLVFIWFFLGRSC